MDAELLQQGLEEIKGGRLTIGQLLKVAMAVEKNAAQLGALSACILDGTVYTALEGKDRPTVKDLRDFAEVHFVLRTVKDAAKEIEKMADKALSGTDERAGNDGHTQRFAERLRDSGLTSFKIEELGSFFIKTKTVALPPGKKEHEQEIESFATLCRSVGLDLDDPKTTLQAANAVATDKGIKVPPYLAFKLYLRSVGLAIEAWNWGSLQTHVQEMSDAGKELPDFIRVVKREEVQFRRA